MCSLQLLKLLFSDGANSVLSLLGRAVRAGGPGLGDRPFCGVSASLGNGTLAATVISLGSESPRLPTVGDSTASSNWGLGSRDCDGLKTAVGLSDNRSESTLRK